jgi:hypothetical protein
VLLVDTAAGAPLDSPARPVNRPETGFIVSVRHSPGSRAGVVAALASLALLAIAGVALAAHPIKGATYTGTFGPVIAHESITFNVSHNGKRVSSFALSSFPVGCQGGAFGSPQPGSGRISRKGKFRVTLKLFFAPNHSTTGTVVVTGRFLRAGKEKGTIGTHFKTSGCDKTESYLAKG